MRNSDFPRLSKSGSFFAQFLEELEKNVSLYLYEVLSSTAEIL